MFQAEFDDEELGDFFQAVLNRCICTKCRRYSISVFIQPDCDHRICSGCKQSFDRTKTYFCPSRTCDKRFPAAYLTPDLAFQFLWEYCSQNLDEGVFSELIKGSQPEPSDEPETPKALLHDSDTTSHDNADSGSSVDFLAVPEEPGSVSQVNLQVSNAPDSVTKPYSTASKDSHGAPTEEAQCKTPNMKTGHFLKGRSSSRLSKAKHEDSVPSKPPTTPPTKKKRSQPEPSDEPETPKALLHDSDTTSHDNADSGSSVDFLAVPEEPGSVSQVNLQVSNAPDSVTKPYSTASKDSHGAPTEEAQSNKKTGHFLKGRSSSRLSKAKHEDSVPSKPPTTPPTKKKRSQPKPSDDSETPKALLHVSDTTSYDNADSDSSVDFLGFPEEPGSVAQVNLQVSNAPDSVTKPYSMASKDSHCAPREEAQCKTISKKTGLFLKGRSSSRLSKAKHEDSVPSKPPTTPPTKKKRSQPEPSDEPETPKALLHDSDTTSYDNADSDSSVDFLGFPEEPGSVSQVNLQVSNAPDSVTKPYSTASKDSHGAPKEEAQCKTPNKKTGHFLKGRSSSRLSKAKHEDSVRSKPPTTPTKKKRNIVTTPSKDGDCAETRSVSPSSNVRQDPSNEKITRAYAKVETPASPDANQSASADDEPKKDESYTCAAVSGNGGNLDLPDPRATSSTPKITPTKSHKISSVSVIAASPNVTQNTSAKDKPTREEFPSCAATSANSRNLDLPNPQTTPSTPKTTPSKTEDQVRSQNTSSGSDIPPLPNVTQNTPAKDKPTIEELPNFAATSAIGWNPGCQIA